MDRPKQDRPRLADTLDDPMVAASLEDLSLSFASAEARDLAMALLNRFSDVTGTPSGEGILFWTSRDDFQAAVDDLDRFRFDVVFSQAERRGWIASLPQVAYRATLYHGKRERRAGSRFATDPGDFGAGRYLTDHRPTAERYGAVHAFAVDFRKAARVTRAARAEVCAMIDLFYRPIRGRDRLAGADRLRLDMRALGVEALVVDGYDCPDSHVTVVDYTAAPAD